MDNDKRWPTYRVEGNSVSSLSDTHLIDHNGQKYAGYHLILDIWGAQHLSDIDYIEEVFKKCIDVSGATLLHIHLHHFAEGNGVSGVAVLAESHISIHTWPEKGYAAFDLFMCGKTNPHAAIPLLLKAFKAQKHELQEILRGQMC